MSKYTGPKCRKCRQLGFSICGSHKCAFERRHTTPGMHQPRRSASDFKKQLMEKQKLRSIYWVGEAQFRNYVKRALKEKGNTGENLLRLLERRLDNMVYRMGFAPTPPAARQMVVHGHILVNGRRLNKPSYTLQAGDEISIREKSRKIALFEEAAIRFQARPQPSYVETDREQMKGKLIQYPSREQIRWLPVDENLVVEYYSRRT